MRRNAQFRQCTEGRNANDACSLSAKKRCQLETQQSSRTLPRWAARQLRRRLRLRLRGEQIFDQIEGGPEVERRGNLRSRIRQRQGSAANALAGIAAIFRRRNRIGGRLARVLAHPATTRRLLDRDFTVCAAQHTHAHERAKEQVGDAQNDDDVSVHECALRPAPSYHIPIHWKARDQKISNVAHKRP